MTASTGRVDPENTLLYLQILHEIKINQKATRKKFIKYVSLIKLTLRYIYTIKCTSNEAPSIEVVRDFWTKIVGTVGKVNKDDSGAKEWLK